jgi:hypothetical protein
MHNPARLLLGLLALPLISALPATKRGMKFPAASLQFGPVLLSSISTTT